jgi:hypothetical protein
MTRLTAVFLGAFLLCAGFAAAQTRTPVVVELFTSEGCSSCPPADGLLMRLTRAFPDIDVIPMSEHVDYWNHLGWTDRFSAPLFSARQQDYGRMFRLENVYTPQMVVDGAAQFNGSDAARAQDEIRKAAMGPKAAMEASMRSADVVHLQIGSVPPGVRNVDLFLVITETGLETVPQAGENGGRRLRHTGVVRNLSSVGHFDTKKSGTYSEDAKITLNPEWRRQNVLVVLYAQDRSTRKIIGAATARP